MLKIPKIRSFVLDKNLESTDQSLLSFQERGYLKDIGWFNTSKHGITENNEFRSIPKLTYPLIKQLEEKLTKEMNVLDYGTSFSTAFYADRSKHVNIAEYSYFWSEVISERLPNNLDTVLTKNKEDNFSKDNGEFQLIVIDCKNSYRPVALEHTL
jgi:hypothetical protein